MVVHLAANTTFGLRINAKFIMSCCWSFSSYEEKMKERLAKRREKIRLGIALDQGDDEDDAEAFDAESGKETSDAKSLLKDMHQR